MTEVGASTEAPARGVDRQDPTRRVALVGQAADEHLQQLVRAAGGEIPQELPDAAVAADPWAGADLRCRRGRALSDRATLRSCLAAADAVAVLPGSGQVPQNLGIALPANDHQMVVSAAGFGEPAAMGSHLVLSLEPAAVAHPEPEEGYLARLTRFARSLGPDGTPTALWLDHGGFLVVEPDATCLVPAVGEHAGSRPPRLAALTALAACLLEAEDGVVDTLAAIVEHVGQERVGRDRVGRKRVGTGGSEGRWIA